MDFLKVKHYLWKKKRIQIIDIRLKSCCYIIPDTHRFFCISYAHTINYIIFVLTMISLHSLILFLPFKFYGLANYDETSTAICHTIIIKIRFNVTLFLSKTNQIILINALRILSNNKRDFRCSLWRKLVIGVSIWERSLCLTIHRIKIRNFTLEHVLNSYHEISFFHLFWIL